MSHVLQSLKRAADLSERGGTSTPFVRVHLRAVQETDPEDLRAGFDVVLGSQNPGAGLEELHQSGVLEVLPEVTAMVGFGGGAQGHKDLWAHTKTVVAQTDRDVVLRWCALFHDVGKVLTFVKDDQKVSFHGHEAVSARLFQFAARRTGMFDAATAQRISSAISKLGRVESYESDWTDSAVRRLVRELGTSLDDVVRLSSADITTARRDKRRIILNKLDEFVQRALSLSRADAVPPALPKGLGTALCETFGLVPCAGLGRVMESIKSDVEAGVIPRGASLEDVMTVVRSKPKDYGIPVTAD